MVETNLLANDLSKKLTINPEENILISMSCFNWNSKYKEIVIAYMHRSRQYHQGEGVLKTLFCNLIVLNVHVHAFHRGPHDLPREAFGPNCLSRASVPVFLRKYSKLLFSWGFRTPSAHSGSAHS